VLTIFSKQTTDLNVAATVSLEFYIGIFELLTKSRFARKRLLYSRKLLHKLIERRPIEEKLHVGSKWQRDNVWIAIPT